MKWSNVVQTVSTIVKPLLPSMPSISLTFTGRHVGACPVTSWACLRFHCPKSGLQKGWKAGVRRLLLSASCLDTVQFDTKLRTI